MSAGKVVGKLFKWIIVPTAVALAGYMFIGPQIGSQPPEVLANIAGKAISTEANTGDAKPVTEQELEPDKPNYPEPAVSVRVTKRRGTPVNMDESPSSQDQ